MVTSTHSERSARGTQSFSGWQGFSAQAGIAGISRSEPFGVGQHPRYRGRFI
jgi:hypothetical protein